jgi:hypothetical protein
MAAVKYSAKRCLPRSPCVDLLVGFLEVSKERLQYGRRDEEVRLSEVIEDLREIDQLLKRGASPYAECSYDSKSALRSMRPSRSSMRTRSA